MITNPAWYALLPVILLAGLGSVSAKEWIVPAVIEPVQAMALNDALQTGKTKSGALVFSHTPLSKNHSQSCASCYRLESGENVDKTAGVRVREFGRSSFYQGISDNKRSPVHIDREQS